MPFPLSYRTSWLYPCPRCLRFRPSPQGCIPAWFGAGVEWDTQIWMQVLATDGGQVSCRGKSLTLAASILMLHRWAAGVVRLVPVVRQSGYSHVWCQTHFARTVLLQADGLWEDLMSAEPCPSVRKSAWPVLEASAERLYLQQCAMSGVDMELQKLSLFKLQWK
jgi:hypothetical protein